MTEEVKQENTLRDDIVNAVEEVKNAPEVEASEVERPVAEIPATEGRDEKGRFKGKEVADIPVEAAGVDVTAPVVEDAPHALSAAAKAKWKDVPAEIRSEWSKREAEIHKTFTAHDGELRMGREMKEVVSPYMAIIQAEGGTPTTAVRDLLNTAYVLRTGHPVQKAQLIQQVCQQYGIDLGLLSQSSQQHVDPNIAQLQQELAMLKQQSSPEVIQKQLQDRMETDNVNSEVRAFASDPVNKHYETVKPIMASLLNSGAAQNMKEAYELACRAHPTVGSMLEAEKAAAKQAKSSADLASKKKASASITGSPGVLVPNSGLPNRTLREELQANLRAAQSS